jgi:fructose-bisphosphate aldolase class 1
MRNRKSWTSEENELLKAMMAEGSSPFRVSAAFGRNLTSVRRQARKLGLTFPTIRQTRQKLHQATGK